jgi:hypothetical protein
MNSSLIFKSPSQDKHGHKRKSTSHSLTIDHCRCCTFFSQSCTPTPLPEVYFSSPIGLFSDSHKLGTAPRPYIHSHHGHTCHKHRLHAIGGLLLCVTWSHRVAYITNMISRPIERMRARYVMVRLAWFFIFNVQQNCRVSNMVMLYIVQHAVNLSYGRDWLRNSFFIFMCVGLWLCQCHVCAYLTTLMDAWNHHDCLINVHI